VAAALTGLMPVMGSIGTGADLLKRIAAPMIGGLVTSFVLELPVCPAVYASRKWHFEMQRGTADVHSTSIPIPESAITSAGKIRSSLQRQQG
jgi:copper/silver efflux system protein